MLNQVLRPILEKLPENNRFERIWKLAQVDFQKRYYDNNLGLIWALINPGFQVTIYYFAFTYLLKHSVPNYALYLFSGLLFWMFFAEGTKKGLSIMKAKRYLVENIQFNKLDLFYSSTLSVFLGLLFNLTAYMVISLGMGIPLYSTLIYFPLLVVNVFILVLAISLLLATINVYLKDMVHLWDMIILAGFWATPLIYSEEVFSGNLKFLLYLNPLSGIVVNSRATILYGHQPNFYLYLFNIVYALILLGIGVFVFKRFAHKAAEKL